MLYTLKISIAFTNHSVDLFARLIPLGLNRLMLGSISIDVQDWFQDELCRDNGSPDRRLQQYIIREKYECSWL